MKGNLSRITPVFCFVLFFVFHTIYAAEAILSPSASAHIITLVRKDNRTVKEAARERARWGESVPVLSLLLGAGAAFSPRPAGHLWVTRDDTEGLRRAA